MHTSLQLRMAKNIESSVSFVWFRNDLRYHDHEGLLKGHKSGNRLIPIYCFDPRHFKETWHHQFPKTGPHRAKFLIESIQNLKQTLQSKGSDLYVRVGQPEDVIPDLIRLLNCPKSCLIYQEEVTKEELDVEKSLREKCKSLGVNISTYWGASLYHKEDIPFSTTKVPDTYTEFRKAVEARCRPRNMIDMPDKLNPFPSDVQKGKIPSLTELGVEEVVSDKRSAFPFKGGESEGLTRIKSYFFDTDCIATYKETRNGLIGVNYSTKFSPWLSLGCISPRYIYHEVKRYEKERQSNQSTYWVIFELLWRDYFRFVCMKFGERVFYPSGIKGKKDIAWKNDRTLFDMWKDGNTGVPFVDANMRELKETGWMSNRGRQNVASFLIKDLHLDWRLGAEWFESQLLDHDVCSNYGNWNYSAGIGNDPRENRKFNIVKQAFDYDNDGDYVRLWVPELALLKGGMVHTPWKLSAQQLQAAQISLGKTYPNPVMVAPEWSRHDHKANESYGKSRGRGGRGRGASHKAPYQRGMDFYFSSNKK